MDNKNIKGRQMKVKATAYTGSPAEGGDMTYIGTKCRENHTIAVDPKVIPYRSSVYIDGHEYKAHDCGGAIKGNRIDVYFEDHSVALQFGVQYKEVFIWKY